MSEKKSEWIGTAFIGIGLAGLGLFGGLAAASGTMGPAAIPVWAMVIGGGAFLSRSPVARAFAKRIQDDGAEQDVVSDEVDGELDELRARVLELEERQDFAERMLTGKAREAEHQ